MKRAVNELALVLDVHVSPDSAIQDTLRAVHRTLDQRQQVSRAQKQEEAARAGAAANTCSSQAPVADTRAVRGGSLAQRRKKGAAAETRQALTLRDFPLGFSTGDDQLDEAATVLRLLYVADLKDLQSDINATISEMKGVYCRSED
jgi:RLL motif-containing protein 1